MGRMLSIGAEFNRQALNQDNPVLLIFPLFFSGKAGWGEWLLHFDAQRKSTGRSKGHRIQLDFLLHMSNLGQLQLSMTLAGNSMQGIFLLEDQKAVDHLEENLAALKKSLEALGYSVPSLVCRLMRQSNQAALKNILEENRKIPSLSLVDLSA